MLYSHLHWLVIDVHTLEKDLMSVILSTVANPSLVRQLFHATKDAMTPTGNALGMLRVDIHHISLLITYNMIIDHLQHHQLLVKIQMKLIVHLVHQQLLLIVVHIIVPTLLPLQHHHPLSHPWFIDLLHNILQLLTIKTLCVGHINHAGIHLLHLQHHPRQQ